MQKNIDVATVRAFVTVVDTGSVTKAARLLHLSQGAVSQQIKRLEDALGGALFRRQGRRLVLTPKGQSGLAVARDYVTANDEFMAVLQRPEFQGEVKFGAPYDIIGSYTPPILRRFSKAFPAIRVTLVCQDSVLLLLAVKSGDIDLALTTELRCGKGGETLRHVGWYGSAPRTAMLTPGRRFRCRSAPRLASSARRRSAPCANIGVSGRRYVKSATWSRCGPPWKPIWRSLRCFGTRCRRASRVLADGKRLPKLPAYCINLYAGAGRNSVVRAFADEVRGCVTAGISAR